MKIEFCIVYAADTTLRDIEEIEDVAGSHGVLFPDKIYPVGDGNYTVSCDAYDGEQSYRDFLEVVKDMKGIIEIQPVANNDQCYRYPSLNRQGQIEEPQPNPQTAELTAK